MMRVLNLRAMPRKALPRIGQEYICPLLVHRVRSITLSRHAISDALRASFDALRGHRPRLVAQMISGNETQLFLRMARAAGGHQTGRNSAGFAWGAAGSP